MISGFVHGLVREYLLTIGFAASIINAIVGSIMGGISGFYGGKIDMVIQRVVDVLYGIPKSDRYHSSYGSCW